MGRRKRSAAAPPPPQPHQGKVLKAERDKAEEQAKAKKDKEAALHKAAADLKEGGQVAGNLMDAMPKTTQSFAPAN